MQRVKIYFQILLTYTQMYLPTIKLYVYIK